MEIIKKLKSLIFKKKQIEFTFDRRPVKGESIEMYNYRIKVLGKMEDMTNIILDSSKDKKLKDEEKIVIIDSARHIITEILDDLMHNKDIYNQNKVKDIENAVDAESDSSYIG